jgi:hypothetical protein
MYYDSIMKQARREVLQTIKINHNGEIVMVSEKVTKFDIDELLNK